MQTGSITTIEDKLNELNKLMICPNPAKSGGYVSISLEKIKPKIVKAELISIDGKVKSLLFNGYHLGTQESPFMLQLPATVAGSYLIRFTDESGKTIDHKFIITN